MAERERRPAREVLYLRIPADLKQQVDAYAAELGVPANTAAVLLLRAGLKSRR